MEPITTQIFNLGERNIFGFGFSVMFSYKKITASVIGKDNFQDKLKHIKLNLNHAHPIKRMRAQVFRKGAQLKARTCRVTRSQI